MQLSVVTPTLRRPEEIRVLLRSLSGQNLQPLEWIVVDGAPDGEEETRHVAEVEFRRAPFPCRYIRHRGGTAVQRNVGIREARGHMIALIDDDIRLEPDFFTAVTAEFLKDTAKQVGGIVGYRTNEHFTLANRGRWRWYKRLNLLKCYEPGKYDYEVGYPINANMQPPFTGTREVDFMTTSCAVWRREVFDQGLSFDPFFRGYGVLEDAHFSLRAKRKWKLLQCGDARCQHLHSQNGRTNRGKIGYMYVVNYYYVFRDVAGPLPLAQKCRFWRFQVFEFLRMSASALRRLRTGDLAELGGRIKGMVAVASGAAWKRSP